MDRTIEVSSGSFKINLELLVRQLKGIKDLFALTMITEIGDIKRFPHPRQLLSWIGMDIREYSSGGKHPNEFKVACARKMGGVCLGVSGQSCGIRKTVDYDIKAEIRDVEVDEEIYDEMHVDGSVYYAIVDGEIDPNPMQVHRRLKPITFHELLTAGG